MTSERSTAFQPDGIRLSNQDEVALRDGAFTGHARTQVSGKSASRSTEAPFTVLESLELAFQLSWDGQRRFTDFVSTNGIRTSPKEHTNPASGSEGRLGLMRGRLENHATAPERYQIHDFGLFKGKPLVRTDHRIGGGSTNISLWRAVVPVDRVAEEFGPKTDWGAALRLE